MNIKTIAQTAFLKSSFLSMLEQGVASITSFVTGIILARATTPIFAGHYALILSITLIVLGLQRVIVAVPFNVFYPKLEDQDEKKEYKSAIISIEILFLLVFIPLIVVINKVGLINIEVNPFCLMLFMLGYLAKDFTRQYFFALKMINYSFGMGLFQSVFQIGLLLILWKKEMFNLNKMLIIIGLTSILFTCIFIYKYARLNMCYSTVKKVWKKNWWTAKWSVGISLSDSIKNQVSIWLLNFFVSTSAVGIYNNNNSFAMLPQPVFNGLSQFLLPHFSELFAKKDYKQIKKKSLLAIGTVFLCNSIWMLCLALFGEKLVVLFYGEQYSVVSIILVLCCLRGMLTSISSISSAILQAIEKPQSILYSLIVSIIIVITIGLILTKSLGILGMCISMCIMYFVTVIMQISQIMIYIKSTQYKRGQSCK